MKRLLFYVFVFSWLFGYLDWMSIKLTRLVHPEWVGWMHAHESTYTMIRIPELVVCAPCLAALPLWQTVFKHTEASDEQQSWITHAPEPDSHGFYHLVKRGESWTFVSWATWFLYWLPPSLVWYVFGWRRYVQ